MACDCLLISVFSPNLPELNLKLFCSDVQNNFRFSSDKFEGNPEINKQSYVNFWLNWIKYEAVSYSISRTIIFEYLSRPMDISFFISFLPDHEAPKFFIAISILGKAWMSSKIYWISETFNILEISWRFQKFYIFEISVLWVCIVTITYLNAKRWKFLQLFPLSEKFLHLWKYIKCFISSEIFWRF